MHRKYSTFTVLAVVLLTFMVQESRAQNLARNSTFGRGILGPWQQFAIAGGTPASPFDYQGTTPLGLTAAWDSRGAGTSPGTNSSGWRSGIYQTVTGLTGGVTYEIDAEGQILTGDIGSGVPTVGDDELVMFWVDGTDTSFTTAWPGSTNTLDTLISNVSAWTPLSGTFTPAGTDVIIGFAVFFTDPAWTFSANSSLVDNIRLRPQGSNIWDVVYEGDQTPSTAPGNNAAWVIYNDTAIDQVVTPDASAEVPVGSESYLKFIDTNAAVQWDNLYPNQAFYPGPDGTMVFRIRRNTGYTAISGTTNWIVLRNGFHRLRYRILETAGQLVIQHDDGTATNVTIGGLDTWYTVRITWNENAGNTTITTYVDGVQVDSHAATQTNTNPVFSFNGNDGATSEFDIDWFLLTSDGAFAPGAGPALPAGTTEGIFSSVNGWNKY